MWESYLTGLVVCGGIIMAIGAQNAYVLGLAIRREYHWWSAGLCMSADIGGYVWCQCVFAHHA